MSTHSNTQLTARDLLPDGAPQDLTFFDIANIQKIDEYVVLGKENLQWLIRCLRTTAAYWGNEIKELQSRLDLLKHNGETIRRLAVDFDHPTFKADQLAEPQKDSLGILEPTNDLSKNRPSGSTSYNVCGWCTHATDTVSRSYHIMAECRLLLPSRLRRRHIPQSVLTAYAGWRRLGQTSEITRLQALYPGIEMGHTQVASRYSYTPCFFLHASTVDFALAKAAIQTEIDKKLALKRTYDEKIRRLVALAKRAGSTPLFPQARSKDYVGRGDRVLLLRGFGGKVEAHQGRVLGKKFDDVAIEFLHPIDPLKDGTRCTPHYFGLLSVNDVTFLKQHPSWAFIWVRSSRDSYKVANSLYEAIMTS